MLCVEIYPRPYNFDSRVVSPKDPKDHFYNSILVSVLQ